MKIRFYFHSCWEAEGFKQVALWPAMYFTHNNISRSTLMALSMNLLAWDFGFTIEIQNVDLKGGLNPIERRIEMLKSMGINP